MFALLSIGLYMKHEDTVDFKMSMIYELAVYLILHDLTMHVVNCILFYSSWMYNYLNYYTTSL